MKSVHYLLVFLFGFVGGWGIYQFENRNSRVMYDQPSVCEVLSKNDLGCK